MSSKISNRYYIWGFEEPETALEYSKIQSLAESFYSDFSKKAQIFITTHSPAFIKLKDKPDRVTFYRVYQNIGKDQRLLTYAQTLNEIKQSLFPEIENTEAYKLLQEELHMVEQAQEIEAAVKRLREQQKQINDDLEAVKKQLKKGYPKKVFICEDEDKKVVELWASLLNDEGIKVVSSCGCGKNDIESQIEDLMKINHEYFPLVFRTIDRDGYTEDQIKFIESQINKKYKFIYKYKILPVYEMENFAVINHPKATEDLWKSKKDVVRNDFYKTAENHLATMRNLYSKPNLFGENNQYAEIVYNMFNEAEKNWKYLVNGKGMINGLHCDNYIRENPPTELCELLKEIKIFLNQTKKGHK